MATYCEKSAKKVQNFRHSPNLGEPFLIKYSYRFLYLLDLFLQASLTRCNLPTILCSYYPSLKDLQTFTLGEILLNLPWDYNCTVSTLGDPNPNPLRGWCTMWTLHYLTFFLDVYFFPPPIFFSYVFSLYLFCKDNRSLCPFSFLFLFICQAQPKPQLNYAGLC